MQKSCKYNASIMQNRASTMRVSRKNHASTMQVSRKNHASTMQVLCKNHAGTMQVSCRNHACTLRVKMKKGDPIDLLTHALKAPCVQTLCIRSFRHPQETNYCDGCIDTVREKQLSDFKLSDFFFKF